MRLDPARLAAAGLAQAKRDPLLWFRFSSEAQRRVFRSLNAGLETYLRAGNQAGKAQPLDEPIPTPSGWRKMGELQVGDEVFSCDGTITWVTGVFPQGEQPVVKMLFNDGSWTRCTMDHLWRVRTHQQQYHGVGGRSVLSTRDLVERWGERPSIANRASVELCEPVRYDERELPLAPYLLGALIGDGSLTTSVGFSGVDAEILDRIRGELPQGDLIREVPGSDCDWRITGGATLGALRDLGLFGHKTYDKFIPDKYLWAGVEQRVALLRGLMDTDGTCDQKGTSYFYTISPKLRDDFVALVQSLGGRCSVGEKRPFYTHKGERREGQKCYVILTRIDWTSVFHLSRKRARERVSSLTPDRKLVEIIPDGTAPCQCISVAHESKTYLTRGYIVTHNTTVAAYAVVALARGVSEVDGEALPVLESPNTGAILGKSYKQMSESTVKAVLNALGDWPHKVEKGSQNTVVAIRIKPDRCSSDDVGKWSRILVLPQDGEAPVGIRLDWAWADEPPKEDYWHELRARGRANRPFLRLITMTPLDRREWAWLEREFAGCAEPGKDGKVELRLTVFDNKALGPAHLKQLELQYAKDPLLKARLYGDYEDVVGQCPFDRDGMAIWDKRCRAGVLERVMDLDGHSPVDVETWFGPEKGEGYFVLADPSAGIKDERQEHDPAGILVVSRSKRQVVARWNGYEPAYRVGKIARKLADRYNHAMVAWERNSGYGEPFYMGLDGYGNVYMEHHHDARKVSFYERLGWTTTATSRGVIIGALQKAVIQDGLILLSGEALSSMRGFIMQRTGKVEAGSGRHDEDVILLGLACHLLETMAFYRTDESAGMEFERDVLGVREAYSSDPWAEAVGFD